MIKVKLSPAFLHAKLFKNDYVAAVRPNEVSTFQYVTQNQITKNMQTSGSFKHQGRHEILACNPLQLGRGHIRRSNEKLKLT